MPRLGRKRPASNYRPQSLVVSQQILNARNVSLTADNLQLAAPVPSLIFSNTVSLTTPNLALAAPLVAPTLGAVLTTPNLNLAAPLLIPFQAIALNPSPLIPIPIAGFGYQQADFIELWSNSAAFFQQRVVFRATQTSGATTLPSAGTVTTIAFNNIIEDPYSGWAAVNANQWVAPFAGYYQVTLNVWVTGPSAANSALQVFVQTGKTPGNVLNTVALTSIDMPNAGLGGAEATWLVYLAGGDAVYGSAAIKNSGSSVTTNLVAGHNSSMEIIWISA